MTETLRKEMKIVMKKIHITKEHISFLTKCQHFNLLPKFTFIAEKVVQFTKLSSNEITKKPRKILDCALTEQIDRITKLNSIYSKLFRQLWDILGKNELFEFTSGLKTHISNCQSVRDKKRNYKLQILQNNAGIVTNLTASVKIENFSDTLISTEIENILKLGLEAPIGGIPKKHIILAQFESFF